MRIAKIRQNNFRIYGGINEITFHQKKNKNIALIAGKNGFGKTTFLTSLIWGLYGNLMTQVEDKYRKDIKSVGGYELFLKSLLNRTVLNDYNTGNRKDAKFEVQIVLVDVMIPSIPCKSVLIKRAYNYKTNKESLKILIDGQENELTKEVGYDVFINDFILPREIAKFFFFDAEKIVTLAEAKSKSELRSLSKAYSEVLGIKKYEDLKLNLNTLLTKLRRAGVSAEDEQKLKEFEAKHDELAELIDHTETKQQQLEEEINAGRARLDQLQEQLIREGNDMSLEELKALKERRDLLKKDQDVNKNELKKMMDIVPLVIAGPRFKALVDQVKLEMQIKKGTLDKQTLASELEALGKEYDSGLSEMIQDNNLANQLSKYFNKLSKARLKHIDSSDIEGKILLDFDDETYRRILAMYDYIQNSFKDQFEGIVKREKDVRGELSRIGKKIREGEARKDNPLAKKLREDKEELDAKISGLETKREEIIQELGGLKQQEASNHKVLSEKLKQSKLLKTDQQKYEVTTKLLEKLNTLTARIKEEKKYSLQKSIQLGLSKLMHKNNFVKDVRVRIEEDVMDVDLIDQYGNVIDKDTLSKGEQQLYATALLKALVDESGINFPVFIDSPLQKFDKEHSSNVIQQFYPSISEQVVLFPLLEKELSKEEYNQLKQNLTGVYLIGNTPEGSYLEETKVSELYNKFNQQHVLAY